jgi:hypothetical protein
MQTSFSFLKKAADFRVISETTFEFNFNEFRGGSFDELVPERVFAYEVEWHVKIKWINRGWGSYRYDYESAEEPALPQKIVIKKTVTSVPQWTDTTEEIRFFGKPVFTQSNDWGRRPLIWLSDFKDELVLCENKKQVLTKIKEIQEREK